ncbi:MAG: hypothetical protein K2X03_05080 [Bryobacteraceae bacterium]|nr:hypothetical protein [Bryobacteraceae bacterium]
MKTVPSVLALAVGLIAVSAQSPAPAPKKAPVPPKVIDTGVSTNPRSGQDDPRVGLKAGLYDAGEAAFGLERLASLPKPSGFAPGDVVVTPGPAPAPPPNDSPDPAARLPQAAPNAYGSTNSDLAFSGNHLIVGNYNGINLYDIDNPRKVKIITSLLCPGGQGDVSIYGNLLFMSAEAMNGRLDCGTGGIPLPAGYVPPPPPPPVPGGRRQRPLPPPSPERFRGVRIFDISDIAHPKQVAAVQSCRGSHTHSLLVDPKDKENVYVYISGTSQVRQGEELPGCSAGQPDKNPETALFRIDIIQVPLAHPELAKIVSSPRIFTDTQTGALNGLNKGGTSGEGTQKMSETNQCHDITIFASAGLAAGACSGNGILLDISNPIAPVRIAAVSDPNYAYWHSANFNNAGTKVLFTDEWGGGSQPRCRESDPMSWGADAIFTLANRKLTLASYYKMPAPQTEYENCVAHNGSIVPIPGRDILVQAWYQGGISVVDFTDAAHPFEIAYFDRGPVNGEKRAMGGQWSTYWYNGYIYGAEIARGVDVFRLVPNKFLTQNEIDASNQVHFDYLNVQNQPKVEWPSNLIVARAYVDQLARGTSLPAKTRAELTAAMGKPEPSGLKSFASKLEKAAASAKSAADGDRLKALAAILAKQK